MRRLGATRQQIQPYLLYSVMEVCGGGGIETWCGIPTMCSAVRSRATAAVSCLTVCSARCRSSPDPRPTFGSPIDSQPPADRSDADEAHDGQQQTLVREDWGAL